MEQIKQIQGYENLYEISNAGIVKSYLTNKILKGVPNTKGYHQVYLSKDKKAKGFRIHRLMMLHFGEPPIGDCNQVNHINGIRADNRIENLEWVSNRENSSHSVERHATRTSNFPGVSFSNNHGRYIAQVYHDKKNRYLGLFGNELDAYEAVKQFHIDNGIINRYI